MDFPGSQNISYATSTGAGYRHPGYNWKLVPEPEVGSDQVRKEPQEGREIHRMGHRPRMAPGGLSAIPR